MQWVQLRCVDWRSEAQPKSEVPILQLAGKKKCSRGDCADIKFGQRSPKIKPAPCLIGHDPGHSVHSCRQLTGYTCIHCVGPMPSSIPECGIVPPGTWYQAHYAGACYQGPCCLALGARNSVFENLYEDCGINTLYYSFVICCIMYLTPHTKYKTPGTMCSTSGVGYSYRIGYS
jgi:hypothetical protein